MQKTQRTDFVSLLVNTETLKEMLGCGRPTAVYIGTAANAKININRRVLWNVSLVQKYLEQIAE